MIAECKSCLHLMGADKSADGVNRCRINGLKASPANAEDCRKFVPASDDAPPWYTAAWVVECEARN